jgi:hypothetical protein
MRVISLDFETYYSETISVAGLAPRAYVNHPEFYAYMASASDGEETWAGDLADFNPESLRGNIVISHNAAFDRTVASKVWGPLDRLGIVEWNCTANLAACLCGRRSLADAVHHLFGVQLSKAMRSYMKGRHWRDVKNTPEGAQLLAYAKDDAIWCHKIWTDFLPYWGNFERELSLLTLEASANGVCVDCELLSKYLLATNRQLYEIEKKLPWVQTGGKPTSPKAIAIECRKHGIPCPPVKDEDEDLYEEWEETYKDQFEWVLQVGEWRSVNKLLKTLERLELRTAHDGEMDAPLKYFGAHCLPGDSEVLTPGGWVPLQDWRGGKIAQWFCDGSIKFLPADANAFEVREELLRIRSPYLRGNFTLGHTMPYLTHGVFDLLACKAGEFSTRRSRWVPISGELTTSGVLDEAAMRVLVAVQADGHWTPKKDGGQLQFCLRKPRKISRIKELLTAVGVSFKEQEFPSTPGQKRISVARRDCPFWLTRDKKVFGAWLLDSTLEARRAFLTEVLLWDGFVKLAEFGSSIRENVEWVVTIAHLTGCSAKIHLHKQRGNRRPYFRTFIRPATKALIQTWRDCTVIPSGAVRQVFCPTTSTGYFLVRSEGTVFVTGNTGRWSGDNGVNLQNLRKDAPVYGDVAVNMRSLFVARPGCKLIVADLAQIEPRCLAWCAGDWPFLELVKTGMSPYEAHARISMGWTGGRLKDENPDLYALNKAQVLALGYGCGAERFIQMAWNYCELTLTLSRSREIVDAFRAQNQKIVGLWNELESGLNQSVGQDFELVLPSGRMLLYSDVRRSVKIKTTKDPLTGKVSTSKKAGTMATSFGRKTFFYGGKLCENLIQAMARDVFGVGLLRLHAAGYKILFTVHDEVVIEAPMDADPDAVKQIMEQPIDWAPGLPVAAEVKAMQVYRK